MTKAQRRQKGTTMDRLSHESALFALMATAVVAFVLAAIFRGMHAASQPFGFRFGFTSEQGSVWGGLANLSRLVMWCAVAASALSLVLNVVRFAKT